MVDGQMEIQSNENKIIVGRFVILQQIYRSDFRNRIERARRIYYTHSKQTYVLSHSPGMYTHRYSHEMYRINKIIQITHSHVDAFPINV